MMRTHYCGHLNRQHIGQTVTLCGWAHRRRDHGGVIFIDLRDREGLAQIVVNPDAKAAFAVAESVRSEYVLKIVCEVRARPEGAANANLATGEVEMIATEIEVLNASLTPPFMLDDENLTETVRLEHRYIDLRRPAMQKNMMLRYRVAKTLRDYLDANGFIEVETPMLTRSTPEGARDYLVPSRVHDGQFFALPQSPQLFKQLLMVSGFDRYFQITKCFRDEDLRADRQPEFTQVDLETSFMTENEIMDIVEEMIRQMLKKVQNVDLPASFPRMSFHEAMNRYGSDKPDMRVTLEITEMSDVMKDVDFKVFAGAANMAGGRVAALRVPNGAAIARSEIDAYTEFVKIYGAKGLAYIKINDITKLNEEGLQSPIVKNIHVTALQAIIDRTGAQNGDIVFFGADKAKVVNEALGALRLKVGHDKGHVDGRAWAPLWVVDFPMFEFDEEAGRYNAVHHPFTAPVTEDIPLLKTDPKKVRGQHYDIVVNGVELGGGSIRIHQPAVQKTIFEELLAIPPDETQLRFGYMLEAFKYGAPPHGGIALGFDRLIAILCNTPSIRDVIAFPKTAKGVCLMTDSPSSVTARQLKDLHIEVKAAPKKEAPAPGAPVA